MLNYGNKSRLVQRPIPRKSEFESDEEWYKESIRSILKYYSYNISPQFFGEGTDYVWKYINLFQYYFGEQENISYKFMEEAAEGISMPATWLPGKKLSSLIDHMRGNFIQTLRSYEPKVFSLGREASSEKKEMWDQLMLEAEIKEDLDKMEEQIGESMRMMNDFKPESKEDVEEFMENYKTYSEKLVYSLCSQTMQINNYEELFVKLFVHAYITNVAALKARAENGILRWDVINPINVVYDRCDNDLQRDMRFAGHHYWASVGELFERFDFDEKEREEVYKMAEGGSSKFREHLMDDHIDWFWNKSETDIYVKVFEGEWFYPENKRQIKREDNYGNVHYKPTDKTELSEAQKKKGWEIIDRPMDVVHMGSLIGNKILKNYGKRPNQPRSKSNLAKTELSYHILTPGIELGRTVSPAQKLAQHQDRIDLYRYKIQEKIEQDYGRLLIADMSQIDVQEASDSNDLAIRIKTDHILPYNSAKDEMQMGGRANGSFFYIEDMSLSQSVQYYQGLIQQEELAMEQAASIPKMALGQQENYQPRDVQQRTIAQSTLGNHYQYKIFGHYVNKILQYSANVTKILYTVDDNVFEKYNLGSGEVDFLEKINKNDIVWEDFMVYVDVDDVITNENKQRLVEQAQAAMQNGMLDWTTYLEIEKASTYSEALRISRRASKQMKKQQQRAQQAEQMAEVEKAKQETMKEMQVQQLKNQGTLQQQQLQNRGDVQEQYVQNQGDLMEQVIKSLADADQKDKDRIMQLLQNQQGMNQNAGVSR